jgi:hypothetical protein
MEMIKWAHGRVRQKNSIHDGGSSAAAQLQTAAAAAAAASSTHTRREEGKQQSRYCSRKQPEQAERFFKIEMMTPSAVRFQNIF